jgi:O-antigen/teichoic acid export membrane protein
MMDPSPPPTTEPEESRKDAREGSGLGPRLFLGTLYSIGFQGMNRLSGFLQSVIVARLLGPSDFGILALVTSSLQVFYNPLRAFEDNIVKFAAEAQGERRPAVERILGTALLLLAVVGVSAWVLCLVLAPRMTRGGGSEGLSLVEAARATSLVRLGSAQVLMQPLVVMATGILGGLLLIDVVAKRNIAVRLLLLAGTVVGAKLLGLAGVIWAIVVTELAAVLVSCHLARLALRERDLRLRMGDRRSVREFLSLVAPYYVTTVITGLGPWFSVFVLSRAVGPETAGYWRVALAFFTVSRSISLAVGYTSLPMTTHLLSTNGARLSSALTRVIRISLWVNGGIAVVLVLFAVRLVPFLYGAEYSGAWSAAALLAISTLTMAVRQPLLSYLLGSGQVLVLLFTEAAGVGLYALSVWLGAPSWGVMGVAWAYSGYLLVTLIPPLWCCVVRGNIYLTKLLPIWGGTMAAAVGAGAIVFLLSVDLWRLISLPYALVMLATAAFGLARTDPEVITMLRDRLKSSRTSSAS